MESVLLLPLKMLYQIIIGFLITINFEGISSIKHPNEIRKNAETFNPVDITF